MKIYREGEDVLFSCDDEVYTLTSHPYEPCLYINKSGKIIKTLHNAFEAHILPERLADNGFVLGADGRYYDEESFCEALYSALDYEHPECNFTYAATLSRMEKKCPGDFITDGILRYGVDVGHFFFESENVTVYAVSDLPHIGASDAFTLYQISPEDYRKLLKFSEPDKIPHPPIPEQVASACQKKFLCGESAYQPRYYFNLSHVQKNLAKKEPPKSDVFPFCPGCGRKNTGEKFCRNCGAKLIRPVKYTFNIAKTEVTSCRCKFRLDNGKTVEAVAEYKGGKPGVEEGMYVYMDSMCYIEGRIPLKKKEAEALQTAYQTLAQKEPQDWNLIFVEKQPRLIEQGKYKGVRSFIYEYGDGTIVATTAGSECKIADSLEAFKAIPREKLESMIYANEMSVAR